jgi:hypothetical protein
MPKGQHQTQQSEPQVARWVPHYVPEVTETLAASLVNDRLPATISHAERDAKTAHDVQSIFKSPDSSNDAVAELLEEFPLIFDRARAAAQHVEEVADIEAKGRRRSTFNYNCEQPTTDSAKEPLHVFATTAHEGSLLSLSPKFFKGSRFYARSYSARVDKDLWRRLRNDTAACVLATNFLLVVCDRMQRPDTNYALLTPQPGGPFRGLNLIKRLRAILKACKPMLETAAARGRHVRGVQDGDGKAFSNIVTESAVHNVAESIASLQALYQSKPNAIVEFKVRAEVPILIDAREFNSNTTRSERVYTRGSLGDKLRHGLVAANGRVVLRLSKTARRVLLSYQPSLLGGIAESVPTAVARKHQTSRAPGGLTYVREADDADGLPGRSYYSVHSSGARDGPPRFSSWDPGSRVFAFGWNVNSGEFLATNSPYTVERMRAVLRQVDRLEADAKAAAAGPLRAYLQAQAQALRTKMRNWVSHGHRQFAQFLVDNFDYVFLPKLSIAKLVQRFDEDTDQYRTLNKMATRQLLAWRHGEFHSQVLASKLRFFPGCCVLNINEAYTTKGKQCFISVKRSFANIQIFVSPLIFLYRLQPLFQVHGGNWRQRGVQMQVTRLRWHSGSARCQWCDWNLHSRIDAGDVPGAPWQKSRIRHGSAPARCALERASLPLQSSLVLPLFLESKFCVSWCFMSS